MKRRHFIGAAAALASTSVWPSWLSDAFADPEEKKACDAKGASAGAASPSQSMIDVATAFRKAARAKRPLLVLVIPTDSDAKNDRGHAFGELLNHGADKDLAPLADCDVVCATMEGLRKVVPAAGEGEPLMVLVRTDALPATALQLDAEMPSYDDVVGYGKRSDRKKGANLQLIDQRIALLGGLLRRGLGASQSRLAERAAEARSKLRDQAPAGTHWAHSDGCGVIIEDVRDTSAVGCGMGFVPDKSRRFLYFFTVTRS